MSETYYVPGFHWNKTDPALAIIWSIAHPTGMAHHPHFPDEDMVAQRCTRIFPKPQGWIRDSAGVPPQVSDATIPSATCWSASPKSRAHLLTKQEQRSWWASGEAGMHTGQARV